MRLIFKILLAILLVIFIIMSLSSCKKENILPTATPITVVDSAAYYKHMKDSIENAFLLLMKQRRQHIQDSINMLDSIEHNTWHSLTIIFVSGYSTKLSVTNESFCWKHPLYYNQNNVPVSKRVDYSSSLTGQWVNNGICSWRVASYNSCKVTVTAPEGYHIIIKENSDTLVDYNSNHTGPVTVRYTVK